MHLLSAESAAHRTALAAVLTVDAGFAVDAAIQPTGDILRDGIEVVEPARGLMTVAEAIHVIADLPKPLECWGEKGAEADAPLRLRCRSLTGAAAEGYKNWYAVSLRAHALRVTKQLGPRGHMCLYGATASNSAVLLTGEEYHAWRRDYQIPIAWSISYDPDPEIRALGATGVFKLRSRRGDMFFREEILPGEELRDPIELSRERIRLVEKITAKIAAALPPDLPAEERAARINVELRRHLNERGFTEL